jgi:hypothetical protein
MTRIASGRARSAGKQLHHEDTKITKRKFNGVSREAHSLATSWSLCLRGETALPKIDHPRPMLQAANRKDCQ